MTLDDEKAVPRIARADSGLPPAGQEGPEVTPGEAGGGDTGAIVAPPDPEIQEERLEMGLPDSMGGPVLPLEDGQLSGGAGAQDEDAPPSGEEEPGDTGKLTARAVEAPDGKGGHEDPESGQQPDVNTPRDMGERYWGQASGR